MSSAGAAVKAKVSPWLVCLHPCATARLRLICFPFGGSGAAVFWPWRAALPADVELWSVRLPGRETRITEPFVTDASQAVGFIAEELEHLVPMPTVLYGHSLGAALAFHAMDALRRRAGPLPELLIASGRMPPHTPYPGNWGRCSDEDLAKHVTRLGGAPLELLASEAFSSVFLPRIRADFQLNESIFYGSVPTLDVPITIINGVEDLVVEHEGLKEWRHYTTRRFKSYQVEGGHFFLQSHFRQFIDIVAGELGIIAIEHSKVGNEF